MPQITVEQALAHAAQHHHAGRLPQAEAIYRQVLTHQPANADALHYLGVIAHELGNSEQALDLLHRALHIRPNYAEAHANLGNILKSQGRLDDAVAAYHKAIQLEPNFAEVYSNLGNVLKRQGKLEAAIAAYRHAIVLKPQFADAYSNLGNALKGQGKTAEAVLAYRHAVRLNSQYAEGFNNLGNALREEGKFAEAAEACRQAIGLKPKYAAAHSNLGNALRELGNFDEAARAYQQAIRLRPDYAEAHTNLGVVQRDQGNLNEAILAGRRAVELNPLDAEAHFNLAVTLLLDGDFADGLAEYEWRWKCKDATPARNFAQPQWRGEDLRGRTLLLHADQGFGDTLQFVRFATPIAARGAKVLLECQPALARLLDNAPGVHQIVPSGQPLPAFDLHCPLLSVPLALGTRLESIPAAEPYLHADPILIEKWRNILPAAHDILKVGLAWAGNSAHSNDRNRSLDPRHLAPLGDVKGVRFYNLQKTRGSAVPPNLDLLDFTDRFSDFAETAALIAQLDLVITVDTAIAHLAGAMGKPVWILLPFAPDWRWLLNRDDSPWYPTMRLFRQEGFGQWSGPIHRIVERLARTGNREPAL